MSRSFHSIAAASAVFVATLAACDSTSAPRTKYPVNLQVASLAASSTASAATPPAGLELTEVRLSVGQTSLGSGEQFGCQDCQDEGSEAESDGTPRIATIPATGGPVLLAIERVPAGSYPEAQIDLAKPLTAAFGGAQDNTIEITGKYKGTSFTIAFPILGTFHQVLTPPVVVAANAGAPVSVTIALPVAAWFTASDGTALDPANPAQLSQIQANVRTFFSVDSSEGAPE